jgi:hypothetical protein
MAGTIPAHSGILMMLSHNASDFRRKSLRESLPGLPGVVKCSSFPKERYAMPSCFGACFVPCSAGFRVPLISNLIPINSFPGLHFLQEAAYLFLMIPFAYFPHPIGKRSTQIRFHPLQTLSVSGSVCIVSP